MPARTGSAEDQTGFRKIRNEKRSSLTAGRMRANALPGRPVHAVDVAGSPAYSRNTDQGIRRLRPILRERSFPALIIRSMVFVQKRRKFAASFTVAIPSRRDSIVTSSAVIVRLHCGRFTRVLVRFIALTLEDSTGRLRTGGIYHRFSSCQEKSLARDTSEKSTATVWGRSGVGAGSDSGNKNFEKNFRLPPRQRRGLSVWVC